jgi:hemoglobin-like flavoprotein
VTTDEIALVQNSWQRVVPIRDRAATLFYGRLFELDPSLCRLFNGDMTEQGRKLTTMIDTAVNGLSDLERIVPTVQNLGRRHQMYGVRDQHYDTVVSALLWTLERGLGDAFTPAVRTAWTTTYAALATTMKNAARDAAL